MSWVIFKKAKEFLFWNIAIIAISIPIYKNTWMLVLHNLQSKSVAIYEKQNVYNAWIVSEGYRRA